MAYYNVMKITNVDPLHELYVKHFAVKANAINYAKDLYVRAQNKKNKIHYRVVDDIANKEVWTSVKQKKKNQAMQNPVLAKLNTVLDEDRRITIRRESDMVHHPNHYGGDTTYEVIKVLQAWLTREEFIGFLKGNSIKYNARAGKKNSMEEDHKKAAWYDQYLSDFLAGKKELPQ